MIHLGNMTKIISLRSYSQGYTGIIEEDDKYVFFNVSKKEKIKRLLNYKEDYPTYEHFVGAISKFAPPSFFLKEPIYVESMTIAEIDKMYPKKKHG